MKKMILALHLPPWRDSTFSDESAKMLLPCRDASWMRRVRTGPGRLLSSWSLTVRPLMLLAVLTVVLGCTADVRLKPLPQLPGFEPEPNQYFYFLQAQEARRSGNLDKAIVFMRKAIADDEKSLYLRRELAGIYLQNKEDDRAVEVLEENLEIAPEDVDTLIMYGGIQQVRKQNEAARQAYEKVIEIDPANERVYSLLSGLYLEQNDTDSAERVLQQMLVRFPDSFSAHFLLGRTYRAKNELDLAVMHFEKAAELSPDLLDPKFALMELYQQQGKTADAVRVSEEILAQDPENIQASLELSLYFAKSGRTPESDEILTALGQRSESDFDVIVNVVRLYLDPKRYEDARIVVDGLLKGAPQSSEIHHLAGIAYYGLKQNAEALRHFRMVQPETRFYDDAVVHVAFLLHEDGKPREAIDHLLVAVGLDPQNAEFTYYLGTMYEEVEDYPQAETYLNKAVEADPDEPKYLFRLGVVYDKAGDKDASIEAMRKVIELDPEHANALNYLGYTYADLGRNLDEAERLIKEALKHKPDDGYITDSLGWVYYKKGLYDLALTYLLKAVSIVPDDPIMLEHLGDTYLKLGDSANALKYYKKALSHKEKDTEALEEKIQQLENSAN